ncbi:hypothetical protein HZA57_05680, partial [Candidatus Poribacteria bacterium]|nr:hypothetical protein [Candidatus Poribacteria bacterium]
RQFVQAACKGDLDWATSYCDPSIDSAAREVAKRVQAMNLDPLSYSFQETSAPEGRRGLTALAGGQLLAVELEERGPEDWVIVAVGMGK